MLGEGRHDLIAFLVPQQTVVDEYTGQFVADGPVQQCGDHRGIDATRQPQQHFIVADLLAYGAHTLVGDITWRPQGVAAADLADKATENTSALPRVRDFRVKLHAVEVPCLIGHAAMGALSVLAISFETGWQIDYTVAVAHPHIQQTVAFVAGVVFDVL